MKNEKSHLRLVASDDDNSKHKGAGGFKLRLPPLNLWPSLRALILSAVFVALTIVVRDNPVLTAHLPDGLVALGLLFVACIIMIAATAKSFVVGISVAGAIGAALIYLDPTNYLPLEPKILQGLFVSCLVGLAGRALFPSSTPGEGVGDAPPYNPDLPKPIKDAMNGGSKP